MCLSFSVGCLIALGAVPACRACARWPEAIQPCCHFASNAFVDLPLPLNVVHVQSNAKDVVRLIARLVCQSEVRRLPDVAVRSSQASQAQAAWDYTREMVVHQSVDWSPPVTGCSNPHLRVNRIE